MPINRTAFAVLFVAMVPAAAAAQDSADIVAAQGCEGCKLVQHNLRGLAIKKANFASATLREADMKNSALPDSDFSKRLKIRSWVRKVKRPKRSQRYAVKRGSVLAGLR